MSEGMSESDIQCWVARMIVAKILKQLSENVTWSSEYNEEEVYLSY